MASLKTVIKWKKEFNCDLNIVEISNGKVKRIKCVVCSKYEDRIKSLKGFSKVWVEGTESVKKDSLDKHIKGEPHRMAKNLDLRHSLGATSYQEEVISKTAIGKGLTKMVDSDKQVSLCFKKIQEFC